MARIAFGTVSNLDCIGCRGVISNRRDGNHVTQPSRKRTWRYLDASLVCLVLVCTAHQAARAEKGTAEKPSTVDKVKKKWGSALLRQQANDLRPHVTQPIATSFLSAVEHLPRIERREVHVNKKDGRDAVRPDEFAALAEEEQKRYRTQQMGEHFYYFTNYGSPLAFVRTLEVVGADGLGGLDGARVVDFGFGSIGHLRVMASSGTDVTGIEVHRVLRALYSKKSDAGLIAKAGHDVQNQGRLKLLFGHFPTELEDAVPGDVDLFVSKNTLKRGYIHPEQDVDSRIQIHLGCDDEAFVTAVHRKLKTGGRFLIYNLHPAAAKEGEPYIPWADGRSPFDRDLFNRVGFDVIAFNVDDSAAARQIAAALAWDQRMDLETDLFATYTLVKKRA